jgi:hypothetical protein
MMQVEYWSHEIIEIADDAERDHVIDDRGAVVVDHEHINRAKLRVDTRKWLMSKLLPKRYGDRVSADVTVTRDVRELSEQESLRLVDAARAGRKVGERLWPEWEMVEQAKQDPRTWNALYQQQPASEAGDYFKLEWKNCRKRQSNTALPTMRLLRETEIILSTVCSELMRSRTFTSLIGGAGKRVPTAGSDLSAV